MIRILAAMDSRAFFGAERANLEILWRMKQSGAEVTALVRDEDWPENLHMRAQLDQRGIAWIKAPFPDYPSSRYKRYWPRVLVRNPGAFARLNVITARAIRELAITNLHISSPIQALSLVWTISRSQIPVTFFCNAEPSLHNQLYRLIWRWMGGRVDRFVCESLHMQRVVAAAGVDPGKIAIIASAAPHRFASAPFVVPRYAADSSLIVFGFVGQFTAHKGIAVLLDAFALVSARVPDARLLVAGPTTDPYAQSLVDLWSGFEGGDRIRFCGSVEDIPGFFAACDVHVGPSIGPEAYGLVVVEAKRAARPSIVFDGSGMAELIADGEDGLIAREKTAGALAEQMLVYANDRGRARLDGARALASLTGRLEIDRQDEKWLEVYAAAQTVRAPRRTRRRAQ